MGLWLVVMGGRTADLGWFRTRTDTFHNDLVAMDRDGEGIVRWDAPAVTGDAPAPREFHSLTPLSGGRLFLFGGASPGRVPRRACCQPARPVRPDQWRGAQVATGSRFSVMPGGWRPTPSPSQALRATAPSRSCLMRCSRPPPWQRPARRAPTQQARLRACSAQPQCICGPPA